MFKILKSFSYPLLSSFSLRIAATSIHNKKAYYHCIALTYSFHSNHDLTIIPCLQQIGIKVTTSTSNILYVLKNGTITSDINQVNKYKDNLERLKATDQARYERVIERAQKDPAYGSTLYANVAISSQSRSEQLENPVEGTYPRSRM
ncbi:hypothetical protein NKV53_07715 [Legionella sp. 27cVA30]|uniref:hypothetical protein n=1 Tax=Legionella sp. 27cVA30 TaxID=2905657 RepID=UPI00209C811F|nr:hypothetical protein [Legionella sp. 27cVA30]MCP0914225.1 hypothetical protein [Legionella sp. 27cVA30]